MWCTFYSYLPMSKSHLTRYLGEFMVCVSLVVYVIRLCHAPVNMRPLNRDSDFSLGSMEIHPPSISLANCYMATSLAPAGLL